MASGNAPESIAVEQRPHVELHYRVLSHLDLGKDAANLYDGRHPRRPWVEGLLANYRAAPGRLLLHIIPLLCTDLEGEFQLLRSNPPQALADEAGRRLCCCFADALQSEARRRLPAFEAIEAIDWLDDLIRCRALLYGPTGKSPPPLQIFDAPSLAAEGGWTHGRATVWRGRHYVAASLTKGRAAFVQVLHEEIHPVTDPPIRSEYAELTQDTRADSSGFELHCRLERRAIKIGATVIDEAAPQFGPLYSQWRQRFGDEP